VTIAVTAAGIGTAAVTGLGAFLANVALLRRITLPSRPKLVKLSLVGDVVDIERSTATSREGTFGIWVNDGRGHIRVGDVVGGGGDDTVRRQVLSTFGEVQDATTGRWSGHDFPHASSLGLEFEDVVLQPESGPRDAWLFSGDPQRWAIHIHGFKSSRASALRSVGVFSKAGFTSLVPTYYGESPANERNTTEGATFGEAETADIEAAVAFASQHGAQEIVLVGWSLGAEVSLTLAERSPHRSIITGLVLIGPTLNWRHSLDQGMSSNSIPSWIRRELLWALESTSWSRFARMSMPANFTAHDWTRTDRRPSVPALIIHSRGDTDTSWDDTQRFADNNPETVQLVEFSPAPHLMEWNTQRSAFESLVVTWLDRLRHHSAAELP